jgi:tetratricopeptide (TPR) repeat protein
VGEEGMEMADDLGLEELLASNLITIGTARSKASPEDGADEIERGIELAIVANAPDVITRGYTNLASIFEHEGDLRRSRELLQEAIRQERRFGLRGRFQLGNEIGDEMIAGDWDRSLRLADEFIAECEAGETHVLESQARGARAVIRYARGDTEGAVEDARLGLAAARDAKQPQILWPALVLCIRLAVQSGAADEARPLADELLSLPVHEESSIAADLAWVGVMLGCEADVRAVLEKAPRYTRWHDAAEAILDGAYSRAAELLNEIGEVPETAYARLRAAEVLFEHGRETEAEEQLQQALVFYRSVRATRYIREGEALPAETA